MFHVEHYIYVPRGTLYMTGKGTQMCTYSLPGFLCQKIKRVLTDGTDFI